MITGRMKELGRQLCGPGWRAGGREGGQAGGREGEREGGPRETDGGRLRVGEWCYKSSVVTPTSSVQNAAPKAVKLASTHK